MIECYSCKHVNVRKPHRCFLCDRLINIGQKAFFETGKYDGDFFRRYTCEDCEPLSYDFWEFVDGETCDPVTDFREMLQTSIDCWHKPLNHPLIIDVNCPACGKEKIVDWLNEVSSGAETVECPYCFNEAKVIK